MVAVALDRLHGRAILEFGTGRRGLLGDGGIQAGTAHDPEGGFPRQHRRDRIFKAPGETHLADHLIHRRGEIEGKPALHRSRHATAAGLGPRHALALQEQNPSASGC